MVSAVGPAVAHDLDPVPLGCSPEAVVKNADIYPQMRMPS